MSRGQSKGQKGGLEDENSISFMKFLRVIKVVAYTFLSSDGRNERDEMKGTQ